jgi:hypothetical protein
VCQLKEQVMDHVQSGCQIMASPHFWTEDSRNETGPGVCGKRVSLPFSLRVWFFS